jgi:hypothetical protein
MPLHDKPLGTNGRNVDHLVIGTGGVYSINTKNLSGSVVVKKNALVVNGYRDYPVVHTARNEGRQVGTRLSAALGAVVDVTPVIVVIAESFEMGEQPDEVFVLGLRDVPAWFQARPRTLGLAEASRIYGASRMKDVWVTPVEALGRSKESIADLSGLQVNAWKRGGKDRLYVNDADRSSLGYLDRTTGEICVKDPRRRREVLAILQPHLPNIGR